MPGADRGGARRSLARTLALCLSLLAAPIDAAPAPTKGAPVKGAPTKGAPTKVALLSGKGPRRTPPQPDLRKPSAAALRRQPAVPPRVGPPVSLDPRPVAHPDTPREARIARMRARVEDVLRGPVLGRLRVGIEVMDTQTGEVLLSHNADTAFNPASNTKILTTAAAMKLLGSDWRYRTLLLVADRPQATASLASVEGEAPGVLRGDLFLQGSGDPTLGGKGLAELARTLARAGITRVEGDVLCDGQYRSLEDLVRTGAAPALGGGALSVGMTHRFQEFMTGGRGFLALALVIFGRWSPIGVAIAACFFGLLDALQVTLQPALGDAVHLLYPALVALPYVLTLVALAGVTGRARAPAALATPYDPR